jgi:DNA-binding response OmpR family regulator
MRPTVLIADADEMLAAAYRAFLLAEGFQVGCVTSGLECLEALRQRPPQALILDAELPWGSWTGVMEVMNQDPTIAPVPLVILTARPHALTLPARGLFAPVTLLKPVAPQSMAKILDNLLHGVPADMKV